MSRHWSKSEVAYLRRFATTKKVAELAQRFDTEESEVRAQLAGLGVAARDSEPAAAVEQPELAGFEAGLRALYAQDWAEAERCFAAVLAASETVALSGRARQLLGVCRGRLAEAAAEPADPVLLAVYHKNRGDYAAAQAALAGVARDDDRGLYVRAAVHAAAGQDEQAAVALAAAIALNPVNRVHAFHDADFQALRRREEHAHLFALA